MICIAKTVTFEESEKWYGKYQTGKGQGLPGAVKAHLSPGLVDKY